MSNLDNKPQYSSETRIALVMYGGVSLAIYIYGVAQEFFSLVRATATEGQGKKGRYHLEENHLKGAELIYRDIGQQINSKFIIDILSGTSAGGLNALFLAKAMVNESDFGVLRDLWVNESAIDVLLNDKRSISGKDMSCFKRPDPDKYLLNGQRFYRLMYKTLGDRNRHGPDETLDAANGKFHKKRDISHYVNELDLFVTATDIEGKRVQLNVNPDIIIQPNKSDTTHNPGEWKYREVFNFKFAERSGLKRRIKMINDFNPEYNPLLAFAGRSTAAITPALGSMTIKDAYD